MVINMKNMLRRVSAVFLVLSMLAEFVPAAAAAEKAVEQLPTVEVSETILKGNYFYLANDTVTLAEDANTTYLFTLGRGGNADDPAEITVFFRDFTALYGTNYTACEYGGSAAVVPDGHMSYVEILANAESYEEYPLIAEEDAEEYLLNSAEAVEEYLTEQANGSDGDTQRTSDENEEAAVTGAYAGNPLAEIHAETAGRALNRIPASDENGIVMVNTETGETSGGETDRDAASLTNSFTVRQAETDHAIGTNDTDSAIPPVELKLSFAPGEKTKQIAVTPCDCSEAEGDAMFMLALSAPSDGMELGSRNSIMVTIADADEAVPAQLAFAEPEITADGESAFVTILRSGAINKTVSAYIYTEELDAEGYTDFSPLGAQLIFPFGVRSRTVEIPVNHIRDTEVSFRVGLTAEADCCIAEDAASATVTLTAYQGEEDLAEGAPLMTVPAGGKTAMLAANSASAAQKAAGSALDLSAASISGSGYYNGNGAILLTTHGIDSGVTSSVSFSGDPADGTYAYDGYLVQWALDEGWFFPSYELYLSGRSTDNSAAVRPFKITDDDGYDEKVLTPIYFGTPSLTGARLCMCTTFGSGNDLTVYSVQPIRREFRVELLPAEPMTFRNVSSVEAAAYTAAAINDQKVSSTGEVYTSKYVGDTVSITATDANHYLALAGVELCGRDGEVIGYFPNSNPVSDTFSLELTHDFMADYGSAFTYENNPDLYTQSEAGKFHAMIGTIRLRPRFAYRDVELTIRPDTEGRGSFAEFPETGAQSGWHMGDVVAMSGSMNPEYAASADVTAYAFTVQKNQQTEPLSGSIFFGSSKRAQMTLNDESVTLRPVTTERSNALVVTVPQADYEKFDHEQGIFAIGATHFNAAAQQYEITVLPAGYLSSGQLCSLNAVTLDAADVPVWTEFGNERSYSGAAFYHIADSTATENVIRLTAGNAAAASRSVQGCLYYANVNVSTGRSADAAFPAAGQVISVGGAAAIADAEGWFETEPFPAVPGTWVRYLTASNGNTRLGELYVPSGSGTLSAGMITVPSQSSAGVTVNRISVEQNGCYLVQTVPLGGVATTLRAAVTDNVEYAVGGKTLTERITGVTFVVLDGKTLERKADFIASRGENYDEDPVWVADAGLLTPENSSDYAPGDYLYVEISSDRQVADFEDADDEAAAALCGTAYTPQYCGFTFTSTDSYEPVLMEIAIPLTAENILSGDFKSYYSKEETTQKRKFVTLPYIGGLDALISPAKTTKNNLPYYPNEFDWGEVDDFGKPQSYGGKTASSSHRPAVNMTVSVEARPNGVTRLKIGAAVTFMNSTEEGVSRGRAEKFDSIKNKIAGAFGSSDSGRRAGAGQNIELIYNDYERKLMSNQNYLQSNYGGMSLTFGIQAGFYADFGLVVDADAASESAIGAVSDSHFVLIGLGGYLGFSGSLGYTQYFIIPVITLPGYIGFTGTLAIMGTIGGTGDPNNALNYDQQDSSFVVNDFLGEMEASLNGIFSLTGFLGIGLRSILGVRGTATLTFSVGMNNAYPDLYENCPWWGVDLTLTLGAVIDLTIFSIPFTLTGWDWWQEGFYEYFAENGDTLSLQGMSLRSADTLGYSYQERTGGSAFTGGAVKKPILQSSFAPDSRTVDKVIAENIYARPSTQMLALSDGKMLMVFLDDDPSKADDQITSLYYTVYDGNSWSDPQPVQADETGDFSPSLTDCGDQVLISWVSAPDTSAETDIDRLMDLEVYTAFFNKSTETVGTPTRLTDDIYYDARPIGVYDEETGSIALYYTKNAPEMGQDEEGQWHVSPNVSLVDVVNGLSAMTYSQICYRLYESDGAGGGEWIETYYPNEYTEEQIAKVLTPGERYLDTEVTIETASGANTDPVVTDFCAAPGYNGLAVFAYGIDMDNNYETEDDRELYLQVYDFEEHTLYHPTRLTNNSVSDTLPQLVRSGDMTRLFWLAGSESIFYVNVSDILRYGLNADGSMKTMAEAESAAAEKGLDCDIRCHKVDLRQKSISNSTGSAPTDYVALMADDGSMYVLWGNGTYETPQDGTAVSVNREIYAVGMVQSANGIAWSEPVKLTDSGVVNDTIAAATDSNNRLMIAATRYEMTYDSAAAQPLCVSPMQLVTVSLAQVGSVEVTDIALSDNTPMAGDEITIAVTVKNTGLTTANGYTLRLSETSGAQIGSTIDVSEPLTPGCSDTLRFRWTVPQSFEGTEFTAISREKISAEKTYSNASTVTTAPLKAQAVYRLALVNGYQSGEDFYVDYTIENIGNAASGAGDELRLTFINLYGKSAADFGFAEGDDEIVARVGTLGLNAGERTDGTVRLTLPEGAFDLYGYIDLAGCVVSGDGQNLSSTEEIIVMQTAPINLTIGGGSSVVANGSASLTVDYDAGRLKRPASVVYTVADPELASVSGNTVTALADGETTITATLLPYGTSVTAPLVTRTGGTDTGSKPDAGPKTSFVDVSKTDYFCDAVCWAVKNGITTGTDATHFSPDGYATRAQIVTFLYRFYLSSFGPDEDLDGVSCLFTDVSASAYYYDAVRWAVENGITSGTSETQFSPDAHATRAQTVTFLYRFCKAFGNMKAPGADADRFGDVYASDYFYDAVRWAVENGITNGTSETRFSPDADVTRAQAVTFLNRYSGNIQNAD